MDREFRLGLESGGGAGKRLHEAPAEGAIAGEHVGDASAEDGAHRAGQRPVAEAMAAPVGGDGFAHADPRHHVQPLLQQHRHHLGGGPRVVGVVAIDQHVHIGLDIGESAADDVALALPRLGAQLGTGRARRLGGGVTRVVVEHDDPRVRQGGPEIRHHPADRHCLVITGDHHGDAGGTVRHRNTQWREVTKLSPRPATAPAAVARMGFAAHTALKVTSAA